MHTQPPPGETPSARSTALVSPSPDPSRAPSGIPTWVARCPGAWVATLLLGAGLASCGSAEDHPPVTAKAAAPAGVGDPVATPEPATQDGNGADAARPGPPDPGPAARRDDGPPGGWRLAETDSPYLRQHADNPVTWYPWGEEAFDLARALDVPVFLSIGYSSCHWCHVMEHESFEDEELAAWLDDHFVAIKVDREQRPDVDARYMDFVQASTGSGGWPLTAFLTPEGAPFFGGTYFPPRPMAGRMSFRQVLETMSAAWAHDRESILAGVARNEPLLLRETLPPPGTWDPAATLEAATATLQDVLDPERGGIASNRPQRFPPSTLIDVLLRQHLRGEPVDLPLVETTLDAMAAGGLRDHVGGGFHRYCVDPGWEVPHFEKMLYDNALLAPVYALAARLTGHRRHAAVATDTLDWLWRDMRSPESLLFAARDADSMPFDDAGRPVPGAHPEEGDVYCWTPVQLVAALGEEDGPKVSRLFGVTPAGSFERGLSNPRLPAPLELLAEDPGPGLPTGEALLTWWAGVRPRLLAVRDTRPQAFRDEKCLAAWNGLALTGFARTGRLLEDPTLVERTAALGAAVLEHLVDDEGRVAHQLFEGRVTGRGDLDDHAAVARGLLDAYEACGEPALLVGALRVTRAMVDDFAAPDGGLYQTTGEDPLLGHRRRRQPGDGARPAGHSLALEVLARLAPLDDDGPFADVIERTLPRLGRFLAGSPRGFASLLVAVDAWTGPLAEVVVDGPDAAPLVAAARARPMPASLLVSDARAAAAALAGLFDEEPALLTGRRAEQGALAWVCRRGVCLQPVSEVSALHQALASLEPR